MGIYNKFLDFIGIEESEDKPEDELFEEEGEKEAPQPKRRAEPEPRKLSRETRLQGGGESIPTPNVAAMKMIVYHPVSYEDAQNIIDNLKARKPVIVNMEELDVACAQRILDFISGAIYAINGTIAKISRGIFVVAPTNYDVIGNETGEYEEM
ncbi:MAG: cell division protein SepF [Clostridia bacterium]|nr:cell division protein SepF [Clostridia bacterium]